MDAIPLSGIYGAMALAAKAVSLRRQNPDDKECMLLVNAMREGVQTLAMAASLITYIQNTEDPLIAVGSEGPQEDSLTPADLLRFIADAWENSQQSYWEGDVENFVKTFNKTMEDISVEEFNKAFPGDISVSDILGEEKK